MSSVGCLFISELLPPQVEHLEEELAELKKDLHKEYRFTAFTGELLPTANNLLPTNIFSKMTF